LHSPFAQVARDRLTSEARIGSEFGYIKMPLMAGWALNGEAKLLVFVNGTEANGIASFRMTMRGQTWAVTHLEAWNWSEDHLLNLSPVAIEAKANQLRGKRLYVVALGDSASKEAADLVKLFQEHFNIPAQMLPVMEVPAVGRDPERKQWIAEMLLGAMAKKFPDVVADPDARILSIIDDDMYIRAFNWPFAYSYRYSKRFAVLPTARLNPAFYRYKPSEAIKDERLRKIALKCLGMMYFDFGESEDPSSVMSFEGNIRDVDYQSDHFLITDVMTQPQLDDHE
jgi:predicted Zn-dependent protease